VRINGRWHESSRSAIWTIKEQEEGLIYRGKWLDLPITQEWRLRIVKDNTIEFFVKMMISEDIEVDRLQSNLMLAESYGMWKTGSAQGDFPAFDGDTDDDWQIVYNQQHDHAALSVYSAQSELPEVIFQAKTMGKDAQLRVLNSDAYHRGRVLQYVVPVKQNIAPGEYEYFNGSINIEGT